MNLIPTVRLIRLEESQEGTFGVLLICSQIFCVTLEPSDKLNKIDESCIPAQQYICKKIISLKFGETFEITSVPNRSNILFHAGNSITSTFGCVILAQYYGKLKGDRAVLNSGATFKEFMDIMKDVGMFHLTIKDCY